MVKTSSPFKDFIMLHNNVAKYIKLLKPDHFVWKNNILHCYNGKYWETGDLILRQYISNELYDFLTNILKSCFWNIENKLFLSMKKSLENLHNIRFKKDVIETTKEYFSNSKIEFDTNYYLFGFTNLVYDLELNNFRDYKPEDYVSITTGYDWTEPTESEFNKITDLIKVIFPFGEERDLYLEILSSGLEGRCLEKFIMANGNGKGLLHDLILRSFSDYGFMANVSLLFELSKTGSNPEKNNMQKKRLIFFREPPRNLKLQNSVIKEITGGGLFSARGHNESNTQKKLYGTIILECNQKPLFAEEPEIADIERFLDIPFRSSFIAKNISEVNEKTHIYMPNIEYKTERFQDTHKTAILKILFNSYANYQKRNFKFNVPNNIIQRSNEQLKMSCTILGWINDNYDKSDVKTDYIKIKDMFDLFVCSSFYSNLTKAEKRANNYHSFLKHISTNVFFSKNYKDKIYPKKGKTTVNNVLIGYTLKKEKDSDNDSDKEMYDNNYSDTIADNTV